MLCWQATCLRLVLELVAEPARSKNPT